MSGSGDHSSVAGFTIFEALAATVLMALVVSALGMLTSQWLPNWNRGINRLQSMEKVAIALDRLGADIEAAEFVSVKAEDPKPLFDGASRRLVFVRTIARPNAPQGLEIVNLTEIPADGGFALTRTTAPFRISSGSNVRMPRFVDEVVLIKPPYRIKLSYRGLNSEWSDAWHLQPMLPREVTLAVEGLTGRSLHSLSTSVRLRTQAPVQCANAASLESCLSIIANPPQSADTSGKS